jgi:hypothetical protein
MTSRLFFLFFFLSLTTEQYSQGLYDENEKINLLKSSFKRVKVFDNGKLSNYIDIDTIQRTVSIKSVPVHSMTEYSKVYFFNRHYRLDSTIVILCPVDVDSLTKKLFCTQKIMINVYNYSLADRLMNMKTYLGTKRTYLKTEYFAYDNKDRLIVRLQDEGRTQFYYQYNERNQIIKESVHGAEVSYTYNKDGTLKKRNHSNQTIVFNYTSGHLVKKITTGSNASHLTFEYE